MEALKRVEQFVQQELARHRLPAAYAVVVNGQVVLTGATGGHTPDTPFEIGSITKSFTSTAILQLRDQGLLDLDDPVQKHLLWFQLKGDTHPITLRHLLTASSGIPSGVEGAVATRDYDRVWPSLEQGVRSLRDVTPAFAPGTRFMYSNMGYATP